MSEKVHSLDALRGWLALAVVVPHAWQVFVTPIGGPEPVRLALGIVARVAVLFFFCLSGYVIALSIAGNIRRNGHFKPLAFASSRISRIVPPLLVVFLLAFAMEKVLVAFGAETTPLRNAARSAFSSGTAQQLQSLATLGLRGDLTGFVIGPLWTLGYEMQLYALAGLMAAAVWGPRKWSILALLGLYYFWQQAGPMEMDFRAVAFIGFALGSGAFLLAAPRPIAIGLLALSLTLAAGLLPAALRAPLEMDRHPAWVAFQLACVVLGASVVGLVATLRGSFGRSLGDYSYTLYILHFPLLLFVWFLTQPTGPERYLAALLAVTVTVIACAALGRRIERVKVRVTYQPMAETAVQSASERAASQAAIP